MRRWFRFWRSIKKTALNRRRGYRPMAEGLEQRRLLAAPVIDTISGQTMPAGKTLFVPVTGSDADGDTLTYSVTSSNAQVTAAVRPRGTYLRLTVANFGDMVFSLFNDLAPRTVNTIAGLVTSRFYDGLTFHRIVQNFVIQGGDPQGTGSGGPGFQFDDEFTVGSIFSGNGQLAMANSGKDTNGSQFFVTIGAQRFLDHNHTIWGQLVRGFDVVSRIAAVEVDGNSRPTTPVIITRASVFTDKTDAVLSVAAATGAGPATLTVTANDGQGGTAPQTFTVTPQADTTDDPPILGPIANQVTPANTPISFDLTGTDPENNALEFRAIAAGGTDTGATITVAGNRVTVTPRAGFSGPIRLNVGVKQQGATSRGSSQDPFDTQEIIVAVGDQSFTPTGLDINAVEGMPASNLNVATFNVTLDPSASTDYTARINWGDSQQSDGVVTRRGSDFTVTGTNSYRSAGRYQVRVTITSPRGFVAFATGTATVTDAALTAQAAAAVRARQNQAVTNVTVATFTDANTNARAGDFAATIDWGDGQISDGFVSAAVAGGFTVQGTHTYATTGDRTIRITISQFANTDAVTFNTATAETLASIRELPSNQRIVTQIYLDALERAADAAGLATWTARLDQGATRDQVTFEIQAAVEYRQLVVRKAYRKYLNRDADETGLNFFVTALGSGTIIEQVEATLTASDEYFQNRGNTTTTTFLDVLFRDALGRAIDDVTRASFQQLLNTGSTRRQITDMVFLSAEHQQVAVRAYFQQYLRRVSDPSGLDYFAGVALASGARQEQVVAGICGADEYLDNVQS